jgi:hypothetical protein
MRRHAMSHLREPPAASVFVRPAQLAPTARLSRVRHPLAPSIGDSVFGPFAPPGSSVQPGHEPQRMIVPDHAVRPNFHQDAAQSKERLRYNLMIVWGETGFTESCTSSRDDLSCLGEQNDD